MHSMQFDEAHQALTKKIDDGRTATILSLVMAALAGILFLASSDQSTVTVSALMSIGFTIVAVVFATRTFLFVTKRRRLGSEQS